MSSSLKARITSVGHFLPDDKLTNADLERLVETNDEWIRTRTGITERRVLKDPDKGTSYMAERAAREAIEKAGVDPTEIDAILVATVTPDYMFPATACLVQKRLGCTNAFGYDILAACSGFVYALSTGAMMIESGRYKKVLVIGADKMSSIIDYTDRATCIIFGDGAGAVLLEGTEDGTGVQDFIQRCDGDEDELLCMRGGGSKNPASHATVEEKMHFIRQDGKTVFKKATEAMADISMEIMEKNTLDSGDVAWLVPHQANQRIIDATARRMGLGTDKVMSNIAFYGNTTAATIPLCLYDWQDKLNRGDNLILSAFGGGFTAGALYLKW
ncbi:MAG: ketoacyl-ACP synthase III [Balneolales bacterium]|nr:ketoacyl-ACP synthase III [Balneolales bacterium]